MSCDFIAFGRSFGSGGSLFIFFSAVTVALPRAKRAEIQAEIIRLRKKILQMSAEATAADEIVQVNFQMFPLGALTGGKKS